MREITQIVLNDGFKKNKILPPEGGSLDYDRMHNGDTVIVVAHYEDGSAVEYQYRAEFYECVEIRFAAEAEERLADVIPLEVS